MSQGVRSRKIFTLKLSKFELIHLRDLFSVLLSTDAKQTVSQALAVVEDRTVIEARLWQRVAEACKGAELPTDDDAPDFICAAAASPPVGVFRIAQEPNEQPDVPASNPFGSDEDE